MSQAEMRERINDEIVAALKAGTPPWRRGWRADGGGLPRNALTKARYSGINVLLLLGAQMRRGFSSSRWGSYQQWARIGGQVRCRPDDVPAGEWGTKIVVFKPVKKAVKGVDDDIEERRYCFMKQYTVFCEDQVDGLPPRPIPAASTEFTDYQPAEQAFRATGADIPARIAIHR